LNSAGKKTVRFLLAGACDSYVPCVRCVGWKPRPYQCTDRPGIDKDELEVKTGAKHEHVAIETHLRDAGAARQRVANSNDADVMVAALQDVTLRHAGRHCVLAAHFDVAAAVNNLKHRHKTGVT